MHIRQINWNKINKFTLILKKLKIDNDPTDSGIKFKLTNYTNDSEYNDNDNITLRYFKSDEETKTQIKKNRRIKKNVKCRKSKVKKTAVERVIDCANIESKDKDGKYNESERKSKKINDKFLQMEAVNEKNTVDEVKLINENMNDQKSTTKVKFIDLLLNYLFVRRSNKIIGLQFIYMLLIYENNISNDNINGTREISDNDDDCEEEFYYYPILKVPEKLEMVE